MPSHGGESKGCDSDDGESGVIEEDVHFSEQILSAAIVYCSTPAFKDPIAAFKDKHLHVFAEYVTLLPTSTSEGKEGGGDSKSQGQSKSQSLCPEEVEHSLQCQEVFEEFQALVESLLETFTARGGEREDQDQGVLSLPLSPRHARACAQEFFRECAEAVEGKFVPLFEEHENKWWV